MARYPYFFSLEYDTRVFGDCFYPRTRYQVEFAIIEPSARVLNWRECVVDSPVDGVCVAAIFDNEVEAWGYAAYLRANTAAVSLGNVVYRVKSVRVEEK